MKIIFTGQYGIDTEENLVYINGEKLEIDYSLRLRNHSPSGFAWGYGGSGPSQLALAILLKFASEKKALARYQDFKWDVISRLPNKNIYDEELDISKYI